MNEESSIAWNNIGSTYTRLGNKKLAEYSYQLAFSLDDSNATSINNLARFYRRAGDYALAREYEKAIERFNDRNPYYHFAQGSIAFGNEDFDLARQSFQRAVRLKQEEPDFYLALTAVYTRLGDEVEAQRYSDTAGSILAMYDNIYQPSNEKVKIIDSTTILRKSSPGISIFAPGSRTNRRRSN